MIESISKEKFFSIESLKLSWERYIRIGQREIKDHVGINSFEWKLEENIKRLHEKIIENKYVPSEAFKFKVPKSNRMQRTLTLLQVEDAIVYQTIANKIATDSYDELKKTEFNSFGFPTNDQVALGLDILKEEGYYLGDNDLPNSVNEIIQLLLSKRTNSSESINNGNLIPFWHLPIMCKAHLTGIGFDSINKFLCKFSSLLLSSVKTEE